MTLGEYQFFTSRGSNPSFFANRSKNIRHLLGSLHLFSRATNNNIYALLKKGKNFRWITHLRFHLENSISGYAFRNAFLKPLYALLMDVLASAAHSSRSAIGTEYQLSALTGSKPLCFANPSNRFRSADGSSHMRGLFRSKKNEFVFILSANKEMIVGGGDEGYLSQV